jgi:dTDP-4-dehydrorhamnose 3,5-epimerase
MEIRSTALDGLVLLRPRIFADARGRFHETFNERRFQEITGLDLHFVQDNESVSARNVLRGLHFQVAPFAQGKLVSVARGAVLDVCVDIRPHSPTAGHHFKVRLDEQHREMLWIPPGFAHGFVALEDETLFTYKCTAYYHPEAERTIRWNDPDLAIDWGLRDPLISDKDAKGLTYQAHREAVL